MCSRLTLIGRILFFIAAWETACFTALGSTSKLDLPAGHGPQAGNRPQALAFITQTFGVPMVIELAQPYPAQISVRAGDDTARRALNSLAKKCPATCGRRNGAVIVLQHKVERVHTRLLQLHGTGI